MTAKELERLQQMADIIVKMLQEILQREGVSPSNIRTKLSDEEQIGVIKRLPFRLDARPSSRA
jgi:DNA-binding CsgD family transcriptional regulator